MCPNRARKTPCATKPATASTSTAPAGAAPDSPWGENPTRLGACGLTHPGRNFPGRGGVSARIPASMTRMYALCARAPKRPADQRRYRLRRAALFCHISSAVLRLWHAWHRLWRLLRSVNLDQSPRCGSMWSTSVARTRRPFLEHSRQNGSRRSCMGRMSWVHSSVEYIQRQALDSSLRRSLSLGLCASQ